MESKYSSYVLDSSVWVALFLDKDVHHEKAAAFFDTDFISVYVPYIVIAEVTTVLTYKHSKKQADKFLDFIQGDERFRIGMVSAQEDIRVFKKSKHDISFADTAILGYAQRLELPLFTFDAKMRNAFEK